MQVRLNFVDEDDTLQVIPAFGFHPHHQVPDDVEYSGIAHGHGVEIKGLPAGCLDGKAEIFGVKLQLQGGVVVNFAQNALKPLEPGPDF